jgi:thymidylate kinase
MNKQLLIVITGMNGVGKEVVSTRAAEILHEQGIAATRVYEPRLTPSAAAVQDIILREGTRPQDPFAMALYYFGIHADVLGVIRQIRPNYDVVIADRGPETAWVYNVLGSGLENDPTLAHVYYRLRDIFAISGTVLLDAPVEICLKRAKGQAITDQFQDEEVAKHQRRRGIFKAVALREGWAVVDAEPPIEVVAQNVVEVIKQLITQK